MKFNNRESNSNDTTKMVTTKSHKNKKRTACPPDGMPGFRWRAPSRFGSLAENDRKETCLGGYRQGNRPGNNLCFERTEIILKF